MAYIGTCILQYCWINLFCICYIAELIYSVFDFWFYPPALASQGIDLFLSACILLFLFIFPLECTNCQFTKLYLFYLLNIPFFHSHGYILLRLLPFLTLTNALWTACLLSPINHPPLCCQRLDFVAKLASFKLFSFPLPRAVVSKCPWTHTLKQKSNSQHHFQHNQFYFFTIYDLHYFINIRSSINYIIRNVKI